jgi:sugar lactone lactonase YvrE
MTDMRAVLTLGSYLGESPMWDEDRGILWWIDTYKPTINSFDPRSGRNEETLLAQTIHAIAIRRGGGLVASLQHGFGLVDPFSGEIEILANPLGDAPVKFNDGKCDRRGRFWSGSMANDWVSKIGALYRLDSDGTVKTMDTGMQLSNGMGWSADDRIMYFTDFSQSTIFAYDYDIESGAISNRRPFIIIPDSEGKPDGMTVDTEGCLWVALWDGWGVARFDIKGRRIAKISLPIARPTSCMFGDHDLSTLYVTSATMQLSDEQLATQPLAGALFALKTDTRGVVQPKFGA